MRSICLFSLTTQFQHPLLCTKSTRFDNILNFIKYNFIIERHFINYKIYVLWQNYNNFLTNMSFFFNKDDNKDNLQYDDTAFMHFAITTCLVASITFIGLIIKDVKSSKNLSLKKIEKMGIFQQRVKKNAKKQKYFTSFAFLYKISIVLVCVLFGIFCFSNIKVDSKMIGFDPYQILGVQLDAPVNTVKKAYRKLALEYHPDRNVHNPEAAAKFIQISKAYKCLTDQTAKQNCRKYGNPDGQVSFKVGIGLPRFMVDVQNQYFILIPIFIVLLFVVPRAFIKWSSRIKPMDDNGNLIANYPAFYDLITPAMNPITFALIMGSMKQLDAVFPEKTLLEVDMQNGFKNLLLGTRAVNEQQLAKLSRQTLYRSCAVYSYMANRSKKQGLTQYISELCRKIIMFTLYYSQKGLDGRLLQNNPSWPITYYGIFPTKLAIFFEKQMFNPSIKLGDTKSIQFLDITAQQQLMARNIHIGNLHLNLLWDDNAINNLVGNFAQERQKHIKQQVQSLPALKIQARVLLGDDQVRQMSIDDFAIIEIKVTRKKQTPGYVISKDFNCLEKEQFYLILTYNANLMFFTTVVFKPGELEVVYKYQHRQTVERAMKFDLCLMSANYPNMDLDSQIYLNVIGRIQNRKVEIHKDDQNIEKMPKSFFESLASIDAMNQSDRELSEGSDTEDEQARQGEQRMGGFRQQPSSHGHHHCSQC